MKRIIAIIALALVVSLFSATAAGCNKQIVDLNYKYTNAYVKIGDNWVDLEIKSWTDYDGEQLQITLKDGTVMLVSSYNCILYIGNLPTT